MNFAITQNELDLCRLGMVIARTQLKSMAAIAIAVERIETASEFAKLEAQLDDLCKRIFTGEITGA